ncbi:polyprenyl synthetase family protein [Arthrobacter sp. LAPM80]|uniref:polyprenyl synthetase family protein n=1 Tax=Arthrobacter sp. LAPM80 TaxID=3141788 RepID=UPI00398BA4E8
MIQPGFLLDDSGARAMAALPASEGTGAAALMDWAAFKEQVRESLAGYFSAQKARAGKYSPAFVELWEHLAASTEGGKWMRPKLVHLSYQAFGGMDSKACSDLAAAYEMLHAALVVHDDVIDRDFVRRGAATLGAVYRDGATSQGHDPDIAEHAGYSAAIIAGDLLLTGALRLAGSATVGHEQAGAILETVHEAIFASAAGELDDLLFSLGQDSPGLSEVLNMERLKTAVYSFEMPLRAGALLAGVGIATADALAAVGRDIGVAYQVVDDVLGTFGQESVTGKSVESDLREGKRTILTTFAQESGEFTDTLAAFRDGHADVQDVRQVLQGLGAQEYALNLAQSLVNDALDKAQELGVPEFLYLELSEICDYVLARRN